MTKTPLTRIRIARIIQRIGDLVLSLIAFIAALVIVAFLLCLLAVMLDHLGVPHVAIGWICSLIFVFMVAFRWSLYVLDNEK